MRLTSRTPPVRITAADMVALASLPAEACGLLVRWGMRAYSDGHGIPVGEARLEAGMDDRAWSAFVGVAGVHLDRSALQAGFVLVLPFMRAADSLAAVSAARVRDVKREHAAATPIRSAVGAGHALRGPNRPDARARSAAVSVAIDVKPPLSVAPHRTTSETSATTTAPASIGVIPTTATPPATMPAEIAQGPAAKPRRPARSKSSKSDGADVVGTVVRVPVQADMLDNLAALPPAVPHDPWRDVAAALAARNVRPSDADTAVAEWRTRHSIADVMAAMQATADRQIASPVRYIGTVLSNQTAARRETMPNAVRLANGGPVLPRAVKRRIVVGPRAGWVFEGWTARGHDKGGVSVEDRREVWRNDAGTLSYKRTEAGKAIPTYDEDAGVYEHE